MTPDPQRRGSVVIDSLIQHYGFMYVPDSRRAVCVPAHAVWPFKEQGSAFRSYYQAQYERRT